MTPSNRKDFQAFSDELMGLADGQADDARLLVILMIIRGRIWKADVCFTKNRAMMW